MNKNDQFVLGADSVIDLDGELISKPGSRKEALEILKKLNGKPHKLISSVCISQNNRMIWNYTDRATLFMKEFSEDNLIDYLSKDWDTNLDNNLKDLILSKKTRKFNSLTEQESILYGHGLWRYIDEIFGKNMIPNLIYMFRVSKSIESGCIYIFRTKLKHHTRRLYSILQTTVHQ